MAKPIIMPQVGQDIETGFIGEWLIKQGDYVNKGDIIAEVESEKATFELEAYESGYVIKILYEKGDEVIEDIDKEGKVEKILETEISSPEAKKVETFKDTKLKASPSARRIAKERGIDLQKIAGSGPGGRIIKNDVLSVPDITKTEVGAEVFERGLTEFKAAVLSTEDREIPFSKMRGKIAERLLRSKQTIPHFYLFIDVDMTSVLAWRAAYNQTAFEKISVNDIIVKSTASAIVKFPRMNSHLIENKLIQRKNINIGVAVSIEDGLLVPVIPDANQKTIHEINQLSQKNVESAKKGTLNITSIGTFTISNLGMYAIDIVLPIINPPECAILGVGKIEKRVVPLNNNSIGIRDFMKLSLACDHRAIDGVYASQFLNEIKNHLENITLA